MLAIRMRRVFPTLGITYESWQKGVQASEMTWCSHLSFGDPFCLNAFTSGSVA